MFLSSASVKEDDELYKRIVSSGLKVERPPVDIGTNSSNTFTHLHDDDARPRDMMKIGNQYLESKKRDTSTGLSTTRVSRMKRRSVVPALLSL